MCCRTTWQHTLWVPTFCCDSLSKRKLYVRGSCCPAYCLSQGTLQYDSLPVEGSTSPLKSGRGPKLHVWLQRDGSGIHLGPLLAARISKMLCVCVYVCICVSTCAFVYMCVYIYVFSVCACVYLCVYMYLCVHLYMCYVCLCISVVLYVVG